MVGYLIVKMNVYWVINQQTFKKTWPSTGHCRWMKGKPTEWRSDGELLEKFCHSELDELN